MQEKIQEKEFPKIFQFILWLIFIDVIFFTSRVWVMVFHVYKSSEKISIFMLQDFYFLVIGYHILLLGLSIVNIFTHYFWRITNSLGYYPIAMVMAAVVVTASAINVDFFFRHLHG
ncbi:MAG TPA: hypothetical protein ENN67_06030 [Firmicutes bacterium]|nr:hypothetical protein [Bacillota bacterium]